MGRNQKFQRTLRGVMHTTTSRYGWRTAAASGEFYKFLSRMNSTICVQAFCELDYALSSLYCWMYVQGLWRGMSLTAMGAQAIYRDRKLCC